MGFMNTVYGYPVVPPKKTFSRKQGQHTLFHEKTGLFVVNERAL